MKEDLQHRDQLKFDMKVYHRRIYEGNEQLTVVDLRKDSVELYGDYSGMGNSYGSQWLPLDGVLIKQE